MNSKGLGIIGAALLAGGLFTPIMSVPIVGSVNLFNNGTNVIGIDLLVLAVIAAVLAAKEWFRDLVWPGLAASGILLYEFGSLQFRLAQMREALSKELQGNPFAGIAQGAASAIQLQWGWLVLAAGAGVLVYAGFSAPKEEGIPALNLREGKNRTIAAVSLVLLLFAPAWDLLNRTRSRSTDVAATSTSGLDTNTTQSAANTTPSGPSAEEAAYIKQNLRLYDLRAKYYDSMLDGHVPGVDFKIQNNGNRTLNKVTVRVVFYDAAGNPISEQEYYPVLVTEESFGEDNTPLRPHYIWQQESDKFYEAKNVPSEWAEGKVTATITDIEFGSAGE
jgi:hypothetical protein